MASVSRFREAALHPGLQVLAGVALHRLLGQPPARLGGHEDRFARTLASQPGHQPLAAPVAVDVGGVDEVDARVHRRVEGGHGLRVVDRPPAPADGPGPEADRRDRHPRAPQRSRLHHSQHNSRRRLPVHGSSRTSSTPCPSGRGSTSSRTRAERSSTWARPACCGTACARTSRPRAPVELHKTPDGGGDRRPRPRGHRHRDGGPGPREQPHQAAPASLQRAAARRQEPPLPEAHPRRGVPAPLRGAPAGGGRERLRRALHPGQPGAQDLGPGAQALRHPLLQGDPGRPARAGPASSTRSSAAWPPAWPRSARSTATTSPARTPGSSSRAAPRRW